MADWRVLKRGPWPSKFLPNIATSRTPGHELLCWRPWFDWFAVHSCNVVTCCRTNLYLLGLHCHPPWFPFTLYQMWPVTQLYSVIHMSHLSAKFGRLITFSHLQLDHTIAICVDALQQLLKLFTWRNVPSFVTKSSFIPECLCCWLTSSFLWDSLSIWLSKTRCIPPLVSPGSESCCSTARSSCVNRPTRFHGRFPGS